MAARKMLFLGIVSAISTLVLASDQSPLQDFCIANPSSLTIVNGLACLDPKQAQASHFSFSGLHLAAKPSPAGSGVTPVTVNQIPGLNTLGVSLVRIDFAPNGTITPHYHPRASEILLVLEGSLFVGFVTSNPDNKLITKVLNKGDVFVFPQGLIHFQQNMGGWNTVAVSGLSSQNPGLVLVANTVFGSKPPVSADILAKAFQTDKATVAKIQATF